jgi:soluble lytic murein transglycosylase
MLYKCRRVQSQRVWGKALVFLMNMRRIARHLMVATIGVVAVLGAPSVFAANSDTDEISSVPAASALAGVLPQPLSPSDAVLYRKIFDIQVSGDWRKADKLIKQLEDKALMGHVMAQRFLHPTKYRSKYKELKAWMQDYADHPDAGRLYKLALKRRPANWRHPKKPSVGRIVIKSSATKERPPGKKLSRSQRREVRNLKRKVRGLLRRGWTKAVKKLIATKRVNKLFSNFDMDQARARLAAGYFAAGRDQWALDWASKAAVRSGRYLPEANWTAGLAAWRLGKTTTAAKHFEAATVLGDNSEWLTSAAAFWAARAHLVSRNPEKVNHWLTKAATHTRTFYGLLARRMLGLENTFTWASLELNESTIDDLAASKGGHRVLALMQIGEARRAERDLRGVAARSKPEMAKEILALASHTNMPALALRLNSALYSDGGFDGAAYPLPDWKPDGGYSIDKALVFAVIRQESRFNPMAKSWAGARGLMQLMPRTASFVARDRRFHRWNATRKTLFEPDVNLRLGQKYINILLGDKKIKGDLFLLATAWNGGPGNLNKWRRATDDMNDPLFFIESIPSRETRIFVERVLTNLWIYRDQLGQPSPSLDAIASGKWPTYKALDDETLMVADNVENRGLSGIPAR